MVPALITTARDQEDSRMKSLFFHFSQAIAAIAINSIVALMVLPPPMSEFTTAMKPGGLYVFGMVAFAAYCIFASSRLPKYWSSIGAVVGNILSVAIWAFVVWNSN